jgi:hypothetical protein
MRSNGPVATKELAMTGREWPGGLVASWPTTDIKKIFIYRSGRQHWPFLQSNPQEDDMLRDVMEGNAAHIEPPAVFALHARRQLGGHRRGHSFVHADQTSMARGGACRADRQPAQPRAAELRHPRRRRCRPASPLPEARAELPRDACDKVAPSSSRRVRSVRHDARNPSRVQVVDRHARITPGLPARPS